MNLPEMYGLRKRMDALCVLCDTLEEKGLWLGTGRIPFREAFRLDLAQFCMYLSASDGKINGGEVLFFKVALGFDTSIDELIGTIKEEGIYSEAYENQVPFTIKTLLEMENKLVDNGIDVAGITDNFVDFYYDLGCGIIQADGDIDDNELRDLNIYMSTIYNYAGSSNRRVAERRDCDNGYGNNENRTGKILPNLDFETVKVNGFGNKVLPDIELPSCAMFVTAKHEMGSSNFWAHYYDGEGNKSRAFVNEIGDYEGTTLFNNSNANTGSGILEVEADGKWSLEFMAIPRTVGLEGSSNVKGHGNTVCDAFIGNGKPNIVKFMHDGTSNFCVRIISEEGENNLLVNEIGFYSGEKVFKLEKGMRYFLIIEADGNWTVDFGMGDAQKYYSIKENI